MTNDHLASRTGRLIGQIVDWFIGAVFIVIGIFLGALTFGLGMWFGWAIAALYYFFADGLNNGRSYGKVMLGMRVIDEKTRQPCTFLQSFVRNLILHLLGPIDWIFIVGERRRRLGDMLAGTIVVKT
jgi:uncharacterized RDD family membrane protein YckC